MRVKGKKAMKRLGNLYEKILTPENIEAAYQAYNQNRPTCLRREYKEEEARQILEEMKEDFAKVIGKARRKDFCDKGKWRILEIPESFKSSIAQIAVWNICGIYVERRIHDNSFSSRKGKGGHMCAKKVERFVHTKADRDAKYCFYFDIAKYYAHIDKRIVMDRIEKIFKDKKVIELFRIIVYSTPKGLPIGYPFSHALANLYITPLYYLAHSFKGVTGMYVYMDNHLVFARSKAVLKRVRRSFVKWLSGVGCEIKKDWQIFPTSEHGVRVCGLMVFANKKSRLYKKLWHRTMRNFDRLNKKFLLSDYLSMMSRLGWLDLCKQRYCEAFKKEGGYIW